MVEDLSSGEGGTCEMYVIFFAESKFAANFAARFD